MMTPAELKLAYKAVFETDDGKLVFEDLARRFHMFQPTYSTLGTHDTAFAEGQRSVALFIRNQLIDQKPVPTHTPIQHTLDEQIEE